MELRHLKMVRETARHGSLTKASEVLFLTQSALSHQLKELETELGVVVFHRVNQGLVLTDAGEILVEYANQILQKEDELRTKLEQYKNGEIGKVKISLETYTTYHWLPVVLKEFNHLFPNIEVNISTKKLKRPLELLKDTGIDYAITIFTRDDPAFEFTPLFEDEVIVLMNKSNPLSDHKFITVKDLNNEIIVTHAVQGEYHLILEDTDQEGNLKPKKFIQFDLTGAIVDAVREGLGVAVLSKWAVSPLLSENKNLKALKLTANGISRLWYLASLKCREKRNYDEKFVELLQRYINQP